MKRSETRYIDDLPSRILDALFLPLSRSGYDWVHLRGHYVTVRLSFGQLSDNNWAVRFKSRDRCLNRLRLRQVLVCPTGQNLLRIDPRLGDH
ncbi:hypothetical protein RRG08_063846 [Elysia crispata]|uniref:Uncharacterized protein n=1 Tax=Elysia crispata TaxID=231223 RepID=A0AAE1CT11_9GAST|nr:hypothetical protein RRG08_063846 [Elysia crispata]